MDENNQQPQADNQPMAQPLQDVVPVQAQSEPTVAEQPPVSSSPMMSEQSPTPVAPTAVPAATVAADPGHGLGIASLILAFIFPLVGLILGIVAKGKSKSVGKSNGLALAGIIISILGMVTGLIVSGLLVAAGMSVAAKCKDLGPGTHYENGSAFTCS